MIEKIKVYKCCFFNIYIVCIIGFIQVISQSVVHTFFVCFATSLAKEVMFLVALVSLSVCLVCLFVCLSVDNITQLEALRERRPPWPRQIITPILSTVKMLSPGCKRLPTPLKKKLKKVLDHYLHHDLGMLPLLWCFFAH